MHAHAICSDVGFRQAGRELVAPLLAVALYLTNWHQSGVSLLFRVLVTVKWVVLFALWTKTCERKHAVCVNCRKSGFIYSLAILSMSPFVCGRAKMSESWLFTEVLPSELYRTCIQWLLIPKSDVFAWIYISLSEVKVNGCVLVRPQRIYKKKTDSALVLS